MWKEKIKSTAKALDNPITFWFVATVLGIFGQSKLVDILKEKDIPVKPV